jgi:hypothetical protein
MTTSATATVTAHGKGLIIGLLVLLGVELYLHNDDFLHRYRSVFAVGRAADKIDHVVKMQPTIVFMGNSRVDNGIAPGVVSSTLNLHRGEVFNLGIPGQNTLVLAGVVRNLERRGVLSSVQLRYVMIGLDASLFSLEDDLNYSVFLADRWEMATAGEYRDLFSSVFRLWGFSLNLKGLREPARMQDFIAATLTDREPWGGSVLENLGYRSNQERLTPVQRNMLQDQGAPAALNFRARTYLLTAIDQLLARGICVGVFFTPRYSRINEFERSGPDHDSYKQLLADMQARDVALFHVADMNAYGADLFSDPGHLNEDGARRYSTALATAMHSRWPAIGAVQ